MMTQDEARKLVEKILSFSKFPDCSVGLDASEEAYVRFANNGITTSAFTVERNITIASTRDRKTGVVQTNETDDAALRAAVARSEQLAEIAPANPEYMEPLGLQQYPKVDNWDESTAAARSPVMIPHVRAVIDAASSKKLVAAGFIQRTARVSVIANKRGNFGYHRGADARLSTTIRAADGSSSGWAGHPTARIGEINGALLGETAVQKCLQWSKPQRLEPGQYTVVLEPTAVSDLCASLGFSFSARNAEEGRSFLSKKGGGTQLGEKLFPEHISLISDPLDRRYSGPPWSFSGLPDRRIPWIEKGVIRNLSYDRYWASKTGKEPTPSPSSLILEGGDVSLEDLIRATERGLLVTRFWYIRSVNPQTMQATGLTRDGLFLIENGKVTTPVMNFRFNESPVRMLQNAQRLGRPVRCRGGEGGGMIAPAIQAANFTFSSISDAV